MLSRWDKPLSHVWAQPGLRSGLPVLPWLFHTVLFIDPQAPICYTARHWLRVERHSCSIWRSGVLMKSCAWWCYDCRRSFSHHADISLICFSVAESCVKCGSQYLRWHSALASQWSFKDITSLLIFTEGLLVTDHFTVCELVLPVLSTQQSSRLCCIAVVWKYVNHCLMHYSCRIIHGRVRSVIHAFSRSKHSHCKLRLMLFHSLSEHHKLFS